MACSEWDEARQSVTVFAEHGRLHQASDRACDIRGAWAVDGFTENRAVMIYQSINSAVLGSVPYGTQTLLDIGCGGGAFGAAVKATMPCSVVGVTYSEAEGRLARQNLDHVAVADLNHFDPTSLGQFDCIVCSHVLEHLHEPQQVLARLRACLNPGGRLLVALPNVLFWKQRLQFMRGRFSYTDGGLMDRTHVRFFDWNSAEQLVHEAGFRTIHRHADGGFPLSRLVGPVLGKLIDRWALSRHPGLFGFQFVLSCEAAAVQVPAATDAAPSSMLAAVAN